MHCQKMNASRSTILKRLFTLVKMQMVDRWDVNPTSMHKNRLHNYMLTNKQVIKVIPLFERMNPGAVAKFFFDQSSTHGAFAKDHLIPMRWMSSQAEINAACIQLSFWMTTLIPHYTANLKTWFFQTIYHPITSTTIFVDRPKAWRQSLRSRASGTICVLRMEVKHYLETVLSVNYHRRLVMHLPKVLLLNLCLMMQRTKTPSLKTTRAWTHLQLVAYIKYYHSRPIFE